MPAKRKAIVRRKGQTIEVDPAVYRYNRLKRRQRKEAGKKPPCQK